MKFRCLRGIFMSAALSQPGNLPEHLPKEEDGIAGMHPALLP